MNYINITFVILLITATIVFSYNVSPKIYLYISNMQYREKVSARNEYAIEKIIKSIPLPIEYKNNLELKITNAGINSTEQLVEFAFLSIILPLIMLIGLYMSQKNQTILLLAPIILVIFPQIIISGKMQKRDRAFVFNAYKIYYFLHSQISSGIKPTDAILGLYEIVQNPLIKSSFTKFVATYELTLDLDKSLTVISKSFKGYDAEMMCVCIKQCVDSGKAGKTLLKMEEKMFSKYFSYLQKETAEYRTKLVFCAILAVVPLGILFLGPMIYEAMQAIESVLNIS